MSLALAVLCTGLRGEGGLRWGGVPWSLGTRAKAGIFSSPTIDADGTVYVTVDFSTVPAAGAVYAIPGTATTNPVARRLYTIPEGIRSTPTLGPDGTLYFGADNGVFYAIDKVTGKERATYDAKGESTSALYIQSSAVLSPDGATIYVGVTQWPTSQAGPFPGAILALSTSDLSKRWIRWVDDTVDGSPSVDPNSGRIYVGSIDNYLYAFNPDGTKYWQVKLAGEIWASPAIGGDGTIYIGSLGGQFAAVTPNGTIKWIAPIAAVASAMVGPDETIYITNWTDGQFYALDPSTGTVLWSRFYGKPAVHGDLVSTPTVRADGMIVMAFDDGFIRAFAPGGDVKWSIPPTPDPSVSSPAISPTSDHSIFVTTTGGEVYSIIGNESGLSTYAAWPTFQHDTSRSGVGAKRPESRVINLSTRGFTGPGTPLIAGFYVNGSVMKTLLVRAVGPGLAQFVGGTGTLADPYSITNTSSVANYVENDNWSDSSNSPKMIMSTSEAVGAFPLLIGSKDAAVVAPFLPATGYTQVITSQDGTSGLAMAELYDANQAQTNSMLANVSTRGYVGPGNNVLIAGLTIAGSGELRVLIRGIGPGLGSFGVPDVIKKPMLSLYSGTSVIATNSGWTSGGTKADILGAGSQSGAFALEDGNNDAAMIVALAPGAYTVMLSGAAGETGTGMVEVYALPH